MSDDQLFEQARAFYLLVMSSACGVPECSVGTRRCEFHADGERFGEELRKAEGEVRK
jgi:hypothetical protein